MGDTVGISTAYDRAVAAGVVCPVGQNLAPTGECVSPVSYPAGGGIGIQTSFAQIIQIPFGLLPASLQMQIQTASAMGPLLVGIAGWIGLFIVLRKIT